MASISIPLLSYIFMEAISNPQKFLWQITIQISIPNERTPHSRDPSKSAYCDPELVSSIQQSPTLVNMAPTKWFSPQPSFRQFILTTVFDNKDK